MAPSALGYIICDLALGLGEIDWGKRWLDAMSALLGKMKQGKEAVDEKLKGAAPLPREAAEYTGTYEHAGYGKVTVDADGGKLTVRFGPDRCELRHLCHEQFYLSYGEGRAWLPVKFDYDMDGTINKVMILLESLTGWIEFDKEGEKQPT